MSKRFELFISHAEEDRILAEKLHKFILHKLSGPPDGIFNTAREGNSISPGTKLNEILEVVKSVKCMLVIFTRNSIDSEWVTTEVNFARARDVQIISILAEDVHIGDLPLVVRDDKVNSDYSTRGYRNYLTRTVEDLRVLLKWSKKTTIGEVLEAEGFETELIELLKREILKREIPDQTERKTPPDEKKQILEMLVKRIKFEQCTPLIGALARTPHLPAAASLAEKLATDEDISRYPFSNKKDFARITKYAGKIRGESWTKERIQNELSKDINDDPTLDSSIVGTLAKLSIPLYITTNYDNLLFNALKKQNKTPRRVVPQWRKAVALVYESDKEDDGQDRQSSNSPDKETMGKEDERIYTAEDLVKDPTVESPIIFHLNGNIELPESMVITEDDQLDFLMALAGGKNATSKKNYGSLMIPNYVRERISSDTLLLVGFHLYHWSFRVITRLLQLYSRDEKDDSSSDKDDSRENEDGRKDGGKIKDDFSRFKDPVIQSKVLLPDPIEAEHGMRFIENYLKEMEMETYWEEMPTFSEALEDKWRKYNDARPDSY